MATGISFFDLPSLVQGKVIREHVSAVQKAYTLSDMPEFRDMLESKHYWSNPSPDFFEFYRLLKSLRSGLYLCKTGVWTHGFRVSLDQDIVSFEFCGLQDSVFRIIRLNESYKNLKLKGSFSEASEFLYTFLNNYTLFDPDAVDIYKLGPSYFFVNRSNKTVRWLDGVRHLNEKNECVISDYFGPDHVRLAVQDKVVCLTCLATLRFENYHCPCEKFVQIIEPVNLESFYKSDRPKLKLQFTVEGNDDYVSINAKSFKLEIYNGFWDYGLIEKFKKFERLK